MDWKYIMEIMNAHDSFSCFVRLIRKSNSINWLTRIANDGKFEYCRTLVLNRIREIE